VSRVRRGGFIFVTFVGDHALRHVHVYRDSRLVVKWDLDNNQPMEGVAPRAVLKLIEALVEEGKL
jgi:Domain of unknown function (DUF4160)